MSKFFTKIIICLFLIINTSCVFPTKNKSSFRTCSSDWYDFVEKRLSTKDIQRHGPDLGSLEWRSVIEFKLGIRGNVDIPLRTSDEWCYYINRKFIKYRNNNEI